MRQEFWTALKFTFCFWVISTLFIHPSSPPSQNQVALDKSMAMEKRLGWRSTYVVQLYPPGEGPWEGAASYIASCFGTYQPDTAMAEIVLQFLEKEKISSGSTLDTSPRIFFIQNGKLILDSYRKEDGTIEARGFLDLGEMNHNNASMGWEKAMHRLAIATAHDKRHYNLFEHYPDSPDGVMNEESEILYHSTLQSWTRWKVFRDEGVYLSNEELDQRIHNAPHRHYIITTH